MSFRTHRNTIHSKLFIVFMLSAVVVTLSFSVYPSPSSAAPLTKAQLVARANTQAVSACDYRSLTFHHPYKGWRTASPTRKWCQWTVRAVRQMRLPLYVSTSRQLAKLVYLESNYNRLADNPSSTAFGTYQFLSSTWSAYGCRFTTDGTMQAICGIRYVRSRYGTSDAALNHHFRYNWY